MIQLKINQRTQTPLFHTATRRRTRYPNLLLLIKVESEEGEPDRQLFGELLDESRIHFLGQFMFAGGGVNDGHVAFYGKLVILARCAGKCLQKLLFRAVVHLEIQQRDLNGRWKR